MILRNYVHSEPGSKRTFAAVAAIAFAIVGQWALLNKQSFLLVALLYGAGVGALLTLLRSQPRTAAPSLGQVASPSSLPDNRWQPILVAASVVLAIASAFLNADTSFAVGDAVEYQFTAVGVIAWLASILLFLMAFWHREKSLAEWKALVCARIRDLGAGAKVHVNWTAVALIGVLALGFFYYFHRLDAIPAEMTSDHAEKLLDVNDILEGHHPLFFIRNTGREPLQFYLTVIVMRLTGMPLSHTVLKIGTALIGFLTIPATFLLAREIFDNVVGVLAAFFIAVSHWPLAIARMGLRYPLTPFFTAVSLYYAWRALKYQNRNDYLMAGVWLGVGLYGYIPSRNVPVAVLGLFALWFFIEGRYLLRDRRLFATNLILMSGVTMIVFLPLFRYSLDFPEMFWYRALTRISAAEIPIQGNVILTFLQNLWNLVLMFNWRGDNVWVTNIPRQPTLDMVSSALLLFGVVIAVYRWLHLREQANLYVLCAFAAFLLPSALSLAFPIENPSLVRTGAAIPFAAILLALPLALLVRILQQDYSHRRALLQLAVIGTILVLIVLLNYRWYFVDYDGSYKSHAQNSSEVAAVIKDFANSVGDLQHAYFIGYPYWIDGRAIAINVGDIHWSNYTLDVNQFLQSDDKESNRLFILNPNDSNNYNQLIDHYSWGQTRRYQSTTPGKDFIAFFVPAVAP